MKRAHFLMGLILFAMLGSTIPSTGATNYFTEVFYRDFDLNGISMLFAPVGGDDYYEVQEVTAITELPVGTFGYSGITMPSQYYYWGPITSFSFPFYGKTYTSFGVTSKGRILLGQWNRWLYSGASLSGHFSQPTISPFFADLDVTAGGKVTVIGPWMDGSYTVTFEDVPSEYNPSLRCTFQCQLYPGGGIRMSWINTHTSIYALVGLSRGEGTPANFEETDLYDSGDDPDDPNDVDGDGLPDSWEETYFDSYTNCAPFGHSDSDDYDNMSEYIAGTDPTDASSYFSVGCSMGSSQITLNWNSLTGRVYSIKHTDSLTSPFTNLVDDITPTPPVNSYAAPIGQDGGFFKAAVEIAH